MDKSRRRSLIIVCLTAMMGFGCAGPPSEHDMFSFSESPYRDLGTLKVGEIVHVPTGVNVTKKELFKNLYGSRIVYVGEMHTNMEDHQVQLEVLKALVQRFPGKIAVGMEMFQTPSQAKLDQWSRGKLSEKEFRKIWYKNWDQRYDYYRELLRFVQENKIPLIGLNAPKSLVTAVMQKGLEGLPEESRKAIPELDESNPYHRQSMAAVFGGHGHGTTGFERFYRTMLIWDETMALTLSDYLSKPENSEMKMVVFAGGFHVQYGFGIPRRVFKRLPEPYTVILPHVTEIPSDRQDLLMDVKRVSVPLYLADFVWAVDFRDLEGPKVRLGVQIEAVDGGIKVIKVSPGSTALQMGIQEGDILIAFDGNQLVEPFDLIHLIEVKDGGDSANVRLLRGDQEIELTGEFSKDSNKH